MSKELEEMLKEEPTLTLNPLENEKKEVPSEVTEKEFKVVLTKEEQEQVDAFAKEISLTNSQDILQFGAGAQKKIADFSETALENVRTKDMGEIGQLLTDVLSELKSIEDAEDSKGFLGIFKKGGRKLELVKAKYDKAEVNVDKISKAMEEHQYTLLKDVATLDKMYELNLKYYKELSMYILAGKQKLKEAQEKELPELLEKAKQSSLPEDAQKAKDFSSLCSRFEKKLHDLELTKMISLQMAPQIRLIQENDTTMSEKIQSTLVNTIPLWKSQMVIAIGLSHSTEAARAQRQVSDMTNELLQKNAETLKIASVETAKESQRGIVDMETLKNTNQQLISTLDEVMKIQTEGRQKRQLAETELRGLEGQMRQKLLEISQ